MLQKNKWGPNGEEIILILGSHRVLRGTSCFWMGFKQYPVFLSCLKPRVVLLPLNPCVALITKVCDLCRFCIICSVHSLCWVSLSFRPSMCFVLSILAAWYLFLYWSSLNCITTVFSESSVAPLVDNRHQSPLPGILGLPWSPYKLPLPTGFYSP